MTLPRKPRKRRAPKMDPKAAKAAARIREGLTHLGLEDGYIVVSSIGPYDHNPYDYPLPEMEWPRVFRALYEAVEYAQKAHREGLDKLKISRVSKADVLGGPVTSQVVWRSWTPGTYGGWTRRDPRRGESGRLAQKRAKHPLPALLAREVREMADMLKQAGYSNPSLSARKLSREGMGPHELAERIRHGKSGMGSLHHSHGMRDASPRRAPPLPTGDVLAMARMLTKAGTSSPITKARALAHEGIGPAELAFRLKVDTRPPGRSATRSRRAPKRRAKKTTKKRSGR